MLLASKGGNISAAQLVKDFPKSWLLKVERSEIRVQKSDPRLRAFDKMSDALNWAGADKDLIDHFVDIEASERAAKGAPHVERTKSI